MGDDSIHSGIAFKGLHRVDMRGPGGLFLRLDLRLRGEGRRVIQRNRLHIDQARQEGFIDVEQARAACAAKAASGTLRP